MYSRPGMGFIDAVYGCCLATHQPSPSPEYPGPDSTNLERAIRGQSAEVRSRLIGRKEKRTPINFQLEKVGVLLLSLFLRLVILMHSKLPINGKSDVLRRCSKSRTHYFQGFKCVRLCTSNSKIES